MIFPSKTLPSEINLATMDDYLDSSIAGQDSGWMTAKLLEEYCKETIIPEYKKRLSPLGPNARGLFILDGHSSRANPDLLETFSAANVDVVTFVSHQKSKTFFSVWVCLYVSQEISLIFLIWV